MTVKQLIRMLLDEAPLNAEVLLVHKDDDGIYEYSEGWVDVVDYEDGSVGLVAKKENKTEMEMDRQEIMERVAERFGIEPNEDGEYDIDDYDWQAGCYCNNEWLNLAVIVEIVEDLMR